MGALDHPQHATFGVACVSNSAAVCDELLASVASMAGSLPDAVLTDRATEIIPFGEGGRGYLRFSYANSQEKIREGMHRLREVVARVELAV